MSTDLPTSNATPAAPLIRRIGRGTGPPIRLAISTCPNDTFAFHGLLAQQVDLCGLNFEIQLLDIQQLNEGLFANAFDIAKASFHAAALLTERTVVLRCGAALGFGVGPLLLAAQPGSTPAQPNFAGGGARKRSLTLCPGQQTTATLLFQLFHGDAIAAGTTEVKQQLFSEIMPALQTGIADFGVCIHEGRFTWEQAGLSLVEDLGSRWEEATGSPLPLGGILANRQLGDEIIEQVQAIIGASIKYGLDHRAETLNSMRAYAQELDDSVLFQHVDLYVNQWTVDLGELGERALRTLSEKAIEAGVVPAGTPLIRVFKAS